MIFDNLSEETVTAPGQGSAVSNQPLGCPGGSDHGDHPITRDHGDSSDIFPVIPCYLPVRSLFRIRRKIFKCHGIRALKACGDENAGIFPVIFPVNGNLGPAFFPVSG